MRLRAHLYLRDKSDEELQFFLEHNRWPDDHDLLPVKRISDSRKVWAISGRRGIHSSDAIAARSWIVQAIKLGAARKPRRLAICCSTCHLQSRLDTGSAVLLPNRYASSAVKVKALSPHHRFVIAVHSPHAVGEIGLCLCRPEKSARKLACGIRRALSPVLFEGKTCRIAAIFNDSCSNAALFLCNPDCVAERAVPR
jgi:hypothetical protein